MKFDWPKFSWIGSPEPLDYVLFMRADTPYKTLADIRKATEPPRCGASLFGTRAINSQSSLKRGSGSKFHMVLGYGGGGENELGVLKKERCSAGLERFPVFCRPRPYPDVVQERIVLAGAQSGAKRYPKLTEVPTIDGVNGNE